MGRFFFFMSCHPRSEAKGIHYFSSLTFDGASPLSEKAPAIGRDFFKCVRSFDFATCVAPLRMTLD